MPYKLGDLTGKKVRSYLFFTLLGVGAFGSVYQAVDVTRGHDSPNYAIKCVPVGKSMKRRRQQILEVSNHDEVAGCPHVMTLCDFFEENIKDILYYFLVFPMCEMDMFKAIWKDRIYYRNDGLIKEVFVNILDGVRACHKKGVFHRDLKPENIMCNFDGRGVLISDFGLSSNQRICRDGGCGTSNYMSPECVEEMEFYYYGDAADVWSLGVILYNMVTCRCPWESASMGDEAFMSFLDDKDHFLKTSPISKPLCRLLDRIFHPIPELRLSVPKIRKAVLTMDTFYKPPRSKAVVAAAKLSEEVALAVIDSEPTRVAPVKGDNRLNKDLACALTRGSLEEIDLSPLNLLSKKRRQGY